MKLIIEDAIVVEIPNAKDMLDVSDWLENEGLIFTHQFGWWIVIEEQHFYPSVETREQFFDILDKFGVNILLERIGHNEYKVVTS